MNILRELNSNFMTYKPTFDVWTLCTPWWRYNIRGRPLTIVGGVGQRFWLSSATQMTQFFSPDIYVGQIFLAFKFHAVHVVWKGAFLLKRAALPASGASSWSGALLTERRGALLREKAPFHTTHVFDCLSVLFPEHAFSKENTPSPSCAMHGCHLSPVND